LKLNSLTAVMHPQFWHKKWESGILGFHRSQPNPSLVKYIEGLGLAAQSRVFVPLCGKSRDIDWLLSKGYRVVGVELSVIAIQQLFNRLSIEPAISTKGAITCYSASNIDILVGNIFDATKALVGSVDLIYDRASLVALPPQMRNQYTAHLLDITAKAPQLLMVFTYEQSLMEGPPFSINSDEIMRHYGEYYDLSRIESTAVKGGLKGKVEAQKDVWLLQTA